MRKKKSAVAGRREEKKRGERRGKNAEHSHVEATRVTLAGRRQKTKSEEFKQAIKVNSRESTSLDHYFFVVCCSRDLLKSSTNISRV